MKKTAVFFVMAVTILGTALPISAQDYGFFTEWLSEKEYYGAKRQYTEADLEVPEDVMIYLSNLGVSHLTVLRNEMYARHGYIFKTPVLRALFSQVGWYKQNPAAGLSSITSMEAKNVTWIKKIEDEFDWDAICRFMDKREYQAADKLYSTDSAYEDAPLAIPLNVELALNHLYINRARLFRNEIFARHGFEFTDGTLKKIFTRTNWYRAKTKDESRVSKEFDDMERVNLAILREWEWLQILDSVKFSLPTGVTSIPVIGFNALFIKEIDSGGETFYYSWPDAWTAMEEKGKGLDAHVTDVDGLVDEKTAAAIKAEPDPKKKIILYFSNKKYAGYADKIQFNHSDMTVPSYLQNAVETLGVDWYLLLRKEIHARNGAKFIDPKVGPIFKACPWYKAKYDLNPRTLSRFPAGVTVKGQEISNYSLLEGEELQRRMRTMNEVKGAKIACDLQGNYYYVKTGEVYVSDAESLKMGHAFPTVEEFQKGKLQSIFDDLIKSYKFDLDDYREQNAIYEGIGC